jgi:superfamily I DNA/RNA helicase
MQLDGWFNRQSDHASAALNVKKLNHPDGAYRVRTGDWRSIFFRAGDDFLVAAIGPRRDIYERLPKIRLARWAGGITIVEPPQPAATVAQAAASREPRSTVPRAAPEAQNGFSPFDDSMLLRVQGVTDDLLRFLRQMPDGVDVPGVLASRTENVDLAFLLADLWERPQHHLEGFARGVVPSVEDLALDEAELRARLHSAETEREVVAVSTNAQLRRLLDGTIEEWMVYLHPSQRSITRANYNGPARVRGGPGTGKTVVALHRARVLARDRVADGDRVLLTTFLRTLPPVWTSLLGALDARAAARLTITNVDALAMQILREGLGNKNLRVLDDAGRQRLAQPLIRRHRLDDLTGSSVSVLLDEFDQYLFGRGIAEFDDYLTLRRRGSGSALRREERERVFDAYTEYLGLLYKHNAYDWPRIRAEALIHARAGLGPRFNGVVVDEAQDLTAVGVALLLTLDASENHRHFLLAGDGQQSIYPGGFSLREVGIDIVGRSSVLTANWRNTWSVWIAAQAVMGDQPFDDLDEDVGLRPLGDEPAPLTIGDDAELLLVDDPDEEYLVLAERIASRLSAGADAGDIAVLADTNAKADAAAGALREVGVPAASLRDYDGQHSSGVLCGTFQRAKGLEFKEVFVVGLGADAWPSAGFVPSTLGPEERDERLAIERRKLFVGMTRARDRLVLLAAAPPADIVDRARWALRVHAY